MSSPSWIKPVRLAPRPAFLRSQFATGIAGRENPPCALPAGRLPRFRRVRELLNGRRFHIVGHDLQHGLRLAGVHRQPKAGSPVHTGIDRRQRSSRFYHYTISTSSPRSMNT